MKMTGTEHLNSKLIEKVCERLWIAQSSLKGVGSLFSQDFRAICFDSDELYGIGQLLKKLSITSVTY